MTAATFVLTPTLFPARRPTLRLARRPSQYMQRPIRVAHIFAKQEPPSANDGREDEFEGASKDAEKTDWDQSWQTYRTTSPEKGGVFGIAPPSGNNSNTIGANGDDERPRGPDSEDRFRTERRVADAWTSETAFLLGAGLIAIVAVFYAYVLLTGGLTSNYTS